MKTFGKSLNEALAEALDSDPRVILLGEDIRDPYGGSFKVTKGLSSNFPTRVINTPLSEPAITGIAAGAAVRGLKPVLEIMFGDFLTLCADQIINHISKFSWMYNGQVKVPVVIRVAMGGRRGYGPTHSQALEKIFFGIPGIKIVSPSHFHNVKELLLHSIAEECPVLFIEYKTLYPEELRLPQNGHIGEFSVRLIEDNGYNTVVLFNNESGREPDITILTYGGMSLLTIPVAESLLEEEEITSEIIIPSLIKPFAFYNILDSITRTGRLVIIEEASLSYGWGAEIAAKTLEKGFDILKAPIKRVAAEDLPIPCARPLEEFVLPGIHQIKEAILGVIA